MRPQGPSQGWTVVVTGASSGLGRAMALVLARRGCGLVLSGRDEGRLAEVEVEVQRAGAPWATFLAADLAVEGGAEALLVAVGALGRPVDALVNNAGAGRAGAWVQGSTLDDRRLVRLLVDAPLVLTRGFLEGWRQRGRGAVLNVASTGAFQPGPQTAVYYASKAFLLNWSVALRHEEPWLTVTTLCPGALKTGFSASAGRRDVPMAPGPEQTARRAIEAWTTGRGLVVPGLFNKAMVFLSRLLPPGWVAVGVDLVQRSVRPTR